MEEALKLLLAEYGKNDIVADALGYSERQYRNIRRKIKNGEVLPARTIKLINLKIGQIHSGGECPGESHAHR